MSARHPGFARACASNDNGTAMSKVRGPAVYFPSIEAKYGRSIAEWKTRMRSTGLTTWKELMAWLKTQHGMGHGHANALTIDVLDDLKRESRP